MWKCLQIHEILLLFLCEIFQESHEVRIRAHGQVWCNCSLFLQVPSHIVQNELLTAQVGNNFVRLVCFKSGNILAGSTLFDWRARCAFALTLFPWELLAALHVTNAKSHSDLCCAGPYKRVDDFDNLDQTRTNATRTRFLPANGCGILISKYSGWKIFINFEGIANVTPSQKITQCILPSCRKPPNFARANQR